MTPSVESCQVLQRDRTQMIKFDCFSSYFTRKEEIRKEKTTTNVVLQHHYASLLSLEGIFWFPIPTFLFTLLLLRFPEELIYSTKQWENFFFLDMGLWKCLRLEASFFSWQLTHLLKPLDQFICTIRLYTEGLWLCCLFKTASTQTTQQRGSALSCPFPLLSWTDKTSYNHPHQEVKGTDWDESLPLFLQKLLLGQFSLHRHMYINITPGGNWGKWDYLVWRKGKTSLLHTTTWKEVLVRWGFMSSLK